MITRRLSLLICPDGAAACMPSVRRFDKLVARISGQVCSIDEEVQFVAKDAVRLPVAIQYQGTNEVGKTLHTPASALLLLTDRVV